MVTRGACDCYGGEVQNVWLHFSPRIRIANQGGRGFLKLNVQVSQPLGYRGAFVDCEPHKLASAVV